MTNFGQSEDILDTCCNQQQSQQLMINCLARIVFFKNISHTTLTCIKVIPAMQLAASRARGASPTPLASVHVPRTNRSVEVPYKNDTRINVTLHTLR